MQANSQQTKDINMLSPIEIKEKLADRNLATVADLSKVPYETVRKIARGEFKRPSFEAIKKLSIYLEGQG